MAYSDFTIKGLRAQFGVLSSSVNLNLDTQKIAPGELLTKILKISENLPIKSEKAKSELIVMPILVDLHERNERFFTIYSGDQLNVDKERGLVGECDFILAENAGTLEINTPIITVVEAKKHDIQIGIPQCAAQMLGASIYNEQEGKKIDPIYGCVTTGDDWKFMKLENNVIYADKKTYYLGEIEELLGAFQTIIDYYKEHLN